MQIEKLGKYKQQDILRFWLENAYLKVGILNYGGILQSFQVKTPAGAVDIVLGPETVDDYLRENNYASAIIGRVANRLKDGVYVQNGKQYQLSVNDGEHTNHGGCSGFDKKIYSYAEDGQSLILSCVSPDLDQGFPGNLSLQVSFRLTDNRLEIRFAAESDQDTVFAPTYHPYFQLSGQRETIYDTLLTIPASTYLPLNESGFPTGQLLPVEGTPFDFTAQKPIGRDLFSGDPQLAITKGYDHCFIVNGAHKATAFCPKTGIQMDVASDMPGLQLYTANEAASDAKQSRFFQHCAVCLEPGYFPNALNQEGFDKPILPAHTKTEHLICYTVTLQER